MLRFALGHLPKERGLLPNILDVSGNILHNGLDIIRGTSKHVLGQNNARQGRSRAELNSQDIHNSNVMETVDKLLAENVGVDGILDVLDIFNRGEAELDGILSQLADGVLGVGLSAGNVMDSIFDYALPHGRSGPFSTPRGSKSNKERKITAILKKYRLSGKCKRGWDDEWSKDVAQELLDCKKIVVNVPEAEDGLITLDEVSDGVEVHVYLSNELVVDDIFVVRVTDKDGKYEDTAHLITEADVTAGCVVVMVRPVDVQGPRELVVLSKGGNRSNVVQFELEQVGLPTIDIPDAADGLVDSSENDGGLEIFIRLHGGVDYGDELTIVIHRQNFIDEIPIEVTREDVRTSVVSRTIPPLDYLGEYSVTVALDTGETTNEVKFVVKNSSSMALTLRVPDAEDGYVDPAENADGVEVDIGLSSNVREGDMVTVRLVKPNGEFFDVNRTLTSNDISYSQLSLVIPPLTTVGMYSITAKTPHTLFNKPVAFLLVDDSFEQTLNLSSIDAADGYVNAKEYVNGIDLTTTVGPMTNSKKLMCILIGDEGVDVVMFLVTPGAGTRGYKTVMLNESIPDGHYEVFALLQGDLGEGMQYSNTIEFILDTQGPGGEDCDGLYLEVPYAVDGVVTKEENEKGLLVLVTLPNCAQLGDVVSVYLELPNESVVTVHHMILQSTDLSMHSAPLALPSLTDAGQYTVNCELTDQAGNSTNTKSALSFLYKPSGGGSELMIHAPDAVDGIVCSSEYEDGLEIHVALPSRTVPESSVILALSNPSGQTIYLDHTITDREAINGSVLMITKELREYGSYSMHAEILDDGHKPRDISNRITFRYAEPGIVCEPALVLVIDSARDGVITYNENNAGVQYSVHVPQSVLDDCGYGDKLTAFIRAPDSRANKILRRFDVQSGQSVYGDVLNKLYREGTYHVGAYMESKDVDPSPVISFRLDLTMSGSDYPPLLQIPDIMDDGFLNLDENEGDREAIVVVPPGTDVGDVAVIVLINDATGETITVTEYITSENLDGGRVKMNLPRFRADGRYSAHAVVYDTSGASSMSSETIDFDVDLDRPMGSLSIGITGALSDDALNLDEYEHGGVVNVEAELPLDAKAGDVIELMWDKKVYNSSSDAERSSIAYTITDEDIARRRADIDVFHELYTGYEYDMYAVLRRPSGNQSAESEHINFMVDLVVPQGDIDIRHLITSQGDNYSFVTSELTVDGAVYWNGEAGVTLQGALGTVSGSTVWSDLEQQTGDMWVFKDITGVNGETVTLNVRAVDAVGNYSNYTSVNIKFDTYTPVLNPEDTFQVYEGEDGYFHDFETDRGDEGITWSINESDNLPITINSSTGQVSFTEPQSHIHEMTNTTEFEVTATSVNGNSATRTYDVHVNEKNMPADYIVAVPYYPMHYIDSGGYPQVKDFSYYVVQSDASGNSIELYYDNFALLANWYDRDHNVTKSGIEIGYKGMAEASYPYIPKSVVMFDNGNYAVLMGARRINKDRQYRSYIRIMDRYHSVVNEILVDDEYRTSYMYGDMFNIVGGMGVLVTRITHSIIGDTTHNSTGTKVLYRFDSAGNSLGDSADLYDVTSPGELCRGLQFDNGTIGVVSRPSSDGPIYIRVYTLDGTEVGETTIGRRSDISKAFAIKLINSDTLAIAYEERVNSRDSVIVYSEVSSTPDVLREFEVTGTVRAAEHMVLLEDSAGERHVIHSDCGGLYQTTIRMGDYSRRTLVEVPLYELSGTSLRGGIMKVSGYDTSGALRYYIISEDYVYEHYPNPPQTVLTVVRVEDPNTEPYNLNHTIELVDDANGIFTYDPTTMQVSLRSPPPSLPVNYVLRATDEGGLYLDVVERYPPIIPVHRRSHYT